MVQAFMTNSPGRGWLPCRVAASDTAAYDFAHYPKLSGLLGVTSGTFRTPVVPQDMPLVNSATNLGSQANGSLISHSHAASAAGSTPVHSIIQNVNGTIRPWQALAGLRTGLPAGAVSTAQRYYALNQSTEFTAGSAQSVVDDGNHTHALSIGATGGSLNMAAGIRARHFISSDWFLAE